MRHATHLLLASALLAALASPAAAQRSRAGWIGIALNIPTVDGRTVDDPVVIDEVHRGSPAEAAGLRSGDRLLAVGDLRGADDFRHLPERLRLSAGDSVRVQVERAGRRIDVVLRAAERPDDVRPRTVTLAVETDERVEDMVRAMDSLRVRLIEIGRDERERSSAASGGTQGSRSRLRIVRDEGRAGVSAPFEFFVFRGEAHDSLEQAMERLNRLTESLRQRERQRMAELRSRFSRLERLDEADEQLQVVRAALEEVIRESAELRAAMSDAARASAGLDYALPSWSSPVPVRPRARENRSPEPDPDAAPAFRPLTPYLLGSNMVAGARVIDLGPELARYFDVEGGVLIVEVAPGTPAAMAGITPGDVITRIDQVEIRSVEELRFGVSRSRGSLPISLVRRGSTLEVLLER